MSVEKVTDDHTRQRRHRRDCLLEDVLAHASAAAIREVQDRSEYKQDQDPGERGCRKSDLQRLDVVSFRNPGEQPSDNQDYQKDNCQSNEG